MPRTTGGGRDSYRWAMSRAWKRVTNVSVHMPQELLDAVDAAVETGLATSRSDFVAHSALLLLARVASGEGAPPPPPTDSGGGKLRLVSFTLPRGVVERLRALVGVEYATMSEAVRAAVAYAVSAMAPLIGRSSRGDEGDNVDGLLPGRSPVKTMIVPEGELGWGEDELRRVAECVRTVRTASVGETLYVVDVECVRGHG